MRASVSQVWPTPQRSAARSKRERDSETQARARVESLSWARTSAAVHWERARASTSSWRARVSADWTWARAAGMAPLFTAARALHWRASQRTDRFGCASVARSFRIFAPPRPSPAMTLPTPSRRTWSACSQSSRESGSQPARPGFPAAGSS
jgi:hypothetical protein